MAEAPACDAVLVHGWCERFTDDDFILCTALFTKEVVLKVVTTLSAAASIVGALFIIVGYAVLRELRSVTVYKLVLCLSIADLFASVAFIMDAVSPVVTDQQVSRLVCAHPETSQLPST